jgi:hypothetical protein
LHHKSAHHFKDPQPREFNSVMTGAGGGMRINLPWFNLNLSYAERIGGALPSDGKKGILYRWSG